ncbi:phosphotransferase family protein [Bacillus testis]|uniref:phosphotransferase family protein n=1 Tax=Bacillus testis TaxID=1622072 RepID=UPI00067ED8EC|nr:aminoglycoside phosphotransferase family protein [Bacillus testis]
MDTLTVRVKWKEKSEILENLDGCRFNEFPMKQGLEAEVKMVEACGHFFVLKILNKQAKPDAEKQFRLLKALACQGIAVAEPHGWGTAENGAPVLLTSYDGECMREVAPDKLVSMADALASLHDIPTSMKNEMQLGVKDFPSYFFPACSEYPDLQEKLEQLLSMVDIRQFDMIHGDLHWENVVENEGEMTIIDWTNIQFGDRRYDVA